ncbi:glycosyltransferase [Terrimonas pollutisoli]|uniref:glycosyltransferase n=1 Tax=Terrimonas pollutisoli TaxID=3034147 RepID=UPI0023ED4DE9|nr:hypothetical protein [Terrimonas sp. H1YJ31]
MIKISHTAPLRIVVAGYIVGGPLGGLVWHHLQYVLGLKKMGHEVIFLEDSNDYPSCYNPTTHMLSNDPTYGVQFIKQIFSQFDLQDSWAYYHAYSGNWYGMSEKAVKNFCNTADVFLNLSGMNPMREFLQKIPVRAFVDTDPVFTQIRHLTDQSAIELARKHNCFFSFGENFGKSVCTIPDDNLPWKPTRQPVVPEVWKMVAGNQNSKWSTVMQWDSYKTREYNGKIYGMKSSSFDPYLDLPQSIDESFEIAMGSVTAPKSKLSSLGWIIEDPLAITKSPETYQQYIRSSKGEWSIAKHGYVITNSGWFSERSCCYLASGRPVVVQDTGFSSFIETGIGLFCFNDAEGISAAIHDVNRNYQKHCKNARDVVEAYFGYQRVLDSLLEEAFVSV